MKKYLCFLVIMMFMCVGCNFHENPTSVDVEKNTLQKDEGGKNRSEKMIQDMPNSDPCGACRK